MLIDHWPLLGLRLITPRLELRLPTGEELGDLAAQAGVTGLFAWPRIDDQRQRSLATGYPGRRPGFQDHEDI